MSILCCLCRITYSEVQRDFHSIGFDSAALDSLTHKRGLSKVILLLSVPHDISLQSLKMKVLEANAGLLTNFEVMDLLGKRGADRGPLSGSITVGECKVYEYLAQTPAGTQSRLCMDDFVREIKSFNLTEAEKLQSVNLRPSTAVEVHLIVEDCDERFSSAQVERFHETVTEFLPEPPAGPETEAEAEEAAGEADADRGEEVEEAAEQ